MNLSERFAEIRSAYEMALPEWMEDYEQTGNMHNDPYLLDWDMSPIESNVWGDIRELCLPFYPQLPAAGYFLDFGNPFLKIGIECDGKEWHDAERDRRRDARLAGAGWMIFRLKGHECVREIAIHDDCSDDHADGFDLERHYAETSMGVLKAIKARYFEDEPRYTCLIPATLNMHRTTPETNPVRRPVQSRPARGPRPIADLLIEHFELILKRAERAERMKK